MWTSDVRTLVPSETEPVQIFEEAPDKFGADARAVEIVIAEDQGASGLACAGLGDPEGAGMAEVQITGGRGCEAASVAVVF